jgi:hypothetical protein
MGRKYIPILPEERRRQPRYEADAWRSEQGSAGRSNGG